MSSFIFDKDYELFPWKGKTFNQITSTYQMNKNSGNAIKSTFCNRANGKTKFTAPPVKLYRKEIAINNVAACSSRMISIDELNQPGGSIVKTNPQGVNYYGLVNTLDFNLTSNKYEKPGLCNMNGEVNLCQSQNALRRVRSAGMTKAKSKSNPQKNYYSSSSQYLQSRAKTFTQNQYNYIKIGAAYPYANPSAKPGDPLSTKNMYYPNDVTVFLDNSCAILPNVYYKPNNSEFSQQGGVSSSDRTRRSVYNTITSNASTYKKAYGAQTADALAYGVPGPGYTKKDIVGYPNTNVPVIKPDGTLRTCNTFIYRSR